MYSYLRYSTSILNMQIVSIQYISCNDETDSKYYITYCFSLVNIFESKPVSFYTKFIKLRISALNFIHLQNDNGSRRNNFKPLVDCGTNR